MIGLGYLGLEFETCLYHSFIRDQIFLVIQKNHNGDIIPSEY